VAPSAGAGVVEDELDAVAGRRHDLPVADGGVLEVEAADVHDRRRGKRNSRGQERQDDGDDEPAHQP
jgi:hypothetical protein